MNSTPPDRALRDIGRRSNDTLVPTAFDDASFAFDGASFAAILAQDIC